jgi:hypothetical protein
MTRRYIYVRSAMDNMTMHPLPVALFKLPRSGDTTLQLIAVDLGDDKEPLALTGATITFTVRKRLYPDGEDDIMFIKSTGDGISLVSGSVGYFNISLTAEDLDIAPTQYWYDLTIESAGGNTYRQAMGKLMLLA